MKNAALLFFLILSLFSRLTSFFSSCRCFCCGRLAAVCLFSCEISELRLQPNLFPFLLLCQQKPQPHTETGWFPRWRLQDLFYDWLSKSCLWLFADSSLTNMDLVWINDGEHHTQLTTGSCLARPPSHLTLKSTHGFRNKAPGCH